MDRTSKDMAAEAGGDPCRITILGAGPAGIAAAYSLSKDSDAAVTVLERAPVGGGNSASFAVEGVQCDYGSHRFHPVAGPEIIADLKSLLGDDLLLRPRHGRIRLGGRWIHFPLKPLDALIRLPKRFGFSLLADTLLKPFRRKNSGASFSSILLDGLGPTIANSFYFPYVRKLWGLDPNELAVTLAERRVSSGSVGKILMKMVRLLPGLRNETAGRFYYPRNGFGQISEAMYDSARQNGADFTFKTEITRIKRDGNLCTAVYVKDGDGETKLASDLILSTVPLTTLVALLDPPPPPEVIEAAKSIRFRSMVLIYLVLETDQFTEFDAHYFPELSTPISRMSEPKNYSATAEPKGITVLCAELPCDPNDKWWTMSDAELGDHFCGWLNDLGLPVKAKVRKTETRRLGHAYPVYDLKYQGNFEIVDEWLLDLEGILVFGRQGLFAHDNTHHAFAMAYGATDSIDERGGVDRNKWAAYRAEFAHHTVED